MKGRLVGITLVCVSLYAIFNAEPSPGVSHEEARQRMQRLHSLTQCYADHHGVIIRDIYFREWTLQAPCVLYEHKLACLTPGEMVQAAGWAMPHGQTVNYASKWVRTERAADGFPQLAAHEICHVTGIRDEEETDRCARQTLLVADCGD